MPNFDPLFAATKARPVLYNGISLLRGDKFPVKNGDILLASIEEADNSRKLQGFFIDITGYCEMDGETIRQGKGIKLLFWQDTMPNQVKIKVFTKQNFVWIQNIWENINRYTLRSLTGEIIQKETPGTDYGNGGAAMIVEEIENGRRYRCNDGYPDEDFDDIIFTVQNLGQG